MLRASLAGCIPDAYVPEANLRLSLYRRLARLDGLAAVTDFANELQDRFGPVPDEVAALLTLARLRTVLRTSGVVQADLGPQAVALTPTGLEGLARLGRLGVVRGERVVLPLAMPDPAEQVAQLTAMLAAAD